MIVCIFITIKKLTVTMLSQCKYGINFSYYESHFNTKQTCLSSFETVISNFQNWSEVIKKVLN